MKRKICFITGSRAEYGMLYWLIKEVESDPELELQIIATGAHLSPEFGLTYKEIIGDGFAINEKIEILLSSDTSVGVGKSMGLALISFSECFCRMKPDIVVGMGDRFELLAAMTAAMVSRIPIAHLSGGETTQGAMDEAIRHSLTKMSHLHFTSNSQYRKRVIQMGESPDRVFNFGEVGLENVRRMNHLSRQDLEKDLKISLKKRNIVVTYHPVTLEKECAASQIQSLLAALDELDDMFIVFTMPNADLEGRLIAQRIKDYVRANNHKSAFFTSLGRLRYLSLLKHVDAVVGNSSSGIVEAPSYKIGTINIGDRQLGRMQSSSVINCRPEKTEILAAFAELYSEKFRSSLSNVENPYGDGWTAVKIKKVLKEFDLDNIIKKVFFDIDFDV